MQAITIQQQPIGIIESATKTNTHEKVGRCLESFVFGSLLALLVVVAIPYGTVEAWWIALYECAVFGLSIVWVLSCWLLKTWGAKSFKTFAPLFALTLFALIQAAPFRGWDNTISTDPYETFLFALKLFALTLNGVLLFDCVKDKRRLRLLVHFIIGVVLLSAVFGIVRWVGQKNAVGFVLPALKDEVGFGQFINKNHFSFLIEMGLALTLGFLLGKGGKREHLFFYLTAAFLMWTAIVMTNSRGGLFTLLSSCLLLGATFVFVRRKRANGNKEDIDRVKYVARAKVIFVQIILLVSCLLTLSFFSLWLGGDVLAVRLAGLREEITDTNGEANAGVRRVEVWQSTLKLIKENPFVGSGFGSYTVSITPFHIASGKWTPEAAHNDFLEILSSGGLVGLLIFGWLLCNIYRRVRDNLCTQNYFRRAVCYGALVGLSAVIVHSLFDFSLHVTLNSQIAIALLIAATAKVNCENSNGES